MGSLHSYLMWNFWFGVVGVFLRAAYASFGQYPRTSTVDYRLTDVIVMFISLWFTVWAYVLM